MRFIPTCVGNAIRSRYLSSSTPVHPHVCGERVRRSLCKAYLVGSSPRVWGTLGRGKSGELPARFIPTCVGNAGGSLGGFLAGAVHPHVCGERKPSGYQRLPLPGSSPRVWGTLWAEIEHGSARRFIPTCVGNALNCRISNAARPVHPHVCGERSFPVCHFHRVGGSSPRVWGTPSCV